MAIATGRYTSGCFSHSLCSLAANNANNQIEHNRRHVDTHGCEGIDRKSAFKLKVGSRTRWHKVALVKEQCILDMRKYSFSQSRIELNG